MKSIFCKLALELIIAAVIGLIAESATASGCRSVVSHHGFHHVPYVAPVVAVIPAAVYTPYPVYAVGYNYAPAGDGNAAILRETIDVLKQQNAILLRQGQAPQSSVSNPQASIPQADQSGSLGVVRENCAKCHTGKLAKGGLQLFDEAGQPNAKLTAEQLGNILGRIATDDVTKVMPPPSANKNVTDADRRKMVALFVGSPK